MAVEGQALPSAHVWKANSRVDAEHTC
ncbi:hCG1820488 [Homo sapiens]|nr:hCG1820488 [Homo sapiens]